MTGGWEENIVSEQTASGRGTNAAREELKGFGKEITGRGDNTRRAELEYDREIRRKGVSGRRGEGREIILKRPRILSEKQSSPPGPKIQYFLAPKDYKTND